MLIFYRPITDPYFNIAAEEYFVKHTREDICMIWINEKSVIIGKHQNAYAEINYPYVRVNQIPVIRRISGGGAVYHDTGNVNFTFIRKTDITNPVDYGRFTTIIVKFLQSLGMDVNVNKRNSIFTGNKKISGHAEHVFHDRVLHHGTILFDTDLDALQKSLMPGKDYHGKALTSVRSDVTNIASLLSENIDIQKFSYNLCIWLMEYFPGANEYHLHADEISAINQLSETKYKTWQWNFGYSPAYSFPVNILTVNGIFPITIKVMNGAFVQIDFPDGASNQMLIEILNSMTGILYNESEIDKFVENNLQQLELAGADIVYFSEAFFK